MNRNDYFWKESIHCQIKQKFLYVATVGQVSILPLQNNDFIVNMNLFAQKAVLITEIKEKNRL